MKDKFIELWHLDYDVAGYPTRLINHDQGSNIVNYGQPWIHKLLVCCGWLLKFFVQVSLLLSI